ncbi:MAG: hypothetical protein M3R25_08850, partial [Bacteroidota bacterium]|nr:hypothetical protein [Bacteroidota bacterium]
STLTARSNALTVLKNGMVGIGLPNPGYLLNFSSSFGDKISLWGSSGNHYGFGIQSGLLQIHTDAAVADVAFGYGTSAAFTETMRIKGNGNVGIGTNTPSFKLDVAGRARVRSGGNSANSAGIYYNKVDNSGTASFIGMYSDDYVGFYGDLGAGWDLVMNTVTGNVGIGSLTPSQRLHVVGNGYITGNLGINVANPVERLHVVGGGYITGSLGVGAPAAAHKLEVIGNGFFSGTVTASCGLLVCSDVRYKTNI